MVDDLQIYKNVADSMPERTKYTYKRNEHVICENMGECIIKDFLYTYDNYITKNKKIFTIELETTNRKKNFSFLATIDCIKKKI